MVIKNITKNKSDCMMINSGERKTTLVKADRVCPLCAAGWEGEERNGAVVPSPICDDSARTRGCRGAAQMETRALMEKTPLVSTGV